MSNHRVTACTDASINDSMVDRGFCLILMPCELFNNYHLPSMYYMPISLSQSPILHRVIDTAHYHIYRYLCCHSPHTDIIRDANIIVTMRWHYLDIVYRYCIGIATLTYLINNYTATPSKVYPIFCIAWESLLYWPMLNHDGLTSSSTYPLSYLNTTRIAKSRDS